MVQLPLQKRELPLRSPLTISLVLLSVAFLLLGLRGIIAPEAGAKSLGTMVSNPSDLWLMQTTAARNIGISLLALGLIYLDHRKAIGALLAAATLISGLDLWIVANSAGFAHAAKHAGYFVVLGGFAWFTFRSRPQ